MTVSRMRHLPRRHQDRLPRDVDDGDDLWVANADGGQVTRSPTGNLKPTQIQLVEAASPARSTSATAAGNLRTVTIGGPAPSSAPTTIPFQAKMTVRQEEVFARDVRPELACPRRELLRRQVPRRRLERRPRASIARWSSTSP